MVFRKIIKPKSRWPSIYSSWMTQDLPFVCVCIIFNSKWIFWFSELIVFEATWLETYLYFLQSERKTPKIMEMTSDLLLKINSNLNFTGSFLLEATSVRSCLDCRQRKKNCGSISCFFRHQNCMLYWYSKKAKTSS